MKVLSFVIVTGYVLLLIPQVCLARTEGPKENAYPIGFCDLWINPKAYRGKTLKVSAILVENNNHARVDGADPFLYDPGCIDTPHSTRVNWSAISFEQTTARGALSDIRNRFSDKFMVSRARVTVTGIFTGFWKNSKGGLDWDSEFKILDINDAKPVDKETPWPRWVEESERKLGLKQ